MYRSRMHTKYNNLYREPKIDQVNIVTVCMPHRRLCLKSIQSMLLTYYILLSLIVSRLLGLRMRTNRNLQADYPNQQPSQGGTDTTTTTIIPITIPCSTGKQHCTHGLGVFGDTQPSLLKSKQLRICHQEDRFFISRNSNLEPPQSQCDNRQATYTLLEGFHVEKGMVNTQYNNNYLPKQ